MDGMPAALLSGLIGEPVFSGGDGMKIDVMYVEVK
jgi:hypothetical protein